MIPKFIHLTTPTEIIGSRNNTLYVSYDDGLSWGKIMTIPLSFVMKMVLMIPVLQRLLRKRIHHVIRIDDIYVLFGFGRIYNFNSTSKSLTCTKALLGRRPLCICCVDGSIYYGEYHANENRDLVNIWKSNKKGEDWEVVHTFDSVRHVHGVFYDKYDDCFWISTGDFYTEAAIWKADRLFKCVKSIVGGSQQTRAVQLLISENYILFGSDTPDEQNHLYRLSKINGSVEKLIAVEGSVFYGVKVDDNYYFSTVVEPSVCNKSRVVTLWYSEDDGINWKIFAQHKKDILPMVLFQYGQILFPLNEGYRKYLFYTPLATESKTEFRRHRVSFNEKI